MKSENRHYDKVHKKKQHPAAKCGNTKCLICHSGKVMKMPTRKILQENSKIKNMEEDVKKADITEAEMFSDGWIKSTEQPAIILFEKPIENINPINNTPEDTDIKLVLHGYYNCWTFAVLFPNGAMLNFVANSMKELQDFENRLTFYDCEY